MSPEFTPDELQDIYDALWSMEAERCLNPAGYTALDKIKKALDLTY